MRYLVIISLLLLLPWPVFAQMSEGNYRVVTWQCLNSKESLADGVFTEQDQAYLTIGESSIVLSIKGYPATILTKGEWMDVDGTWCCTSTLVKDDKVVRLFASKVEPLSGGWEFTIYHTQNFIERFGVYLIE